MLRFSLELYVSALRLHLTDEGFDRKLAVLNLAQAVELAVKAALVEKNESIYVGGSKTLNTHVARERLGELWKTPIPQSARIELLIDERNAMQHRYGDLDAQTLDYHLETVTEFLRDLLDEMFTENLDAYVRLTDAALATDCSRFIEARPDSADSGDATAPPESGVPPSQHTDPAAVVIDVFARFERTLRERVRAVHGRDRTLGSTLDVAMKFAANVGSIDGEVVGRIPDIFSLRNAVVHGTFVPSAAQIESARSTLATLVDALRDSGNDTTLRAAVDASVAGIRGTNLSQGFASESRRAVAASHATRGPATHVDSKDADQKVERGTAEQGFAD